MSRSVLSCGLAIALLAGNGCGGRQTKTVPSARAHKLQVEVDELKAQRRRDRRRIRDLENRRAVEHDRARRDLPVVVRGPEPADPPEAEPMVPAEGTTSENGVIAYSDDDLEVVYVGEAAKDESVRPSIKLHERETRERPTTAARSAPSPAPSRTYAPIPPPGERLAVTKGGVPPLAAADKALAKPAPAPAKPAPAKPAAATDDPRVLYKRYYKAVRAGNHQYAIVGFRAFLERFPSHDLADNAQYWLGEAFYDQKKYDEALVEFGRVAKRYPKGNKVGDAALKLGYTYLAMGRIEDGRAALNRVIETYPDSNAARLAADRLNKLDDDKDK